MTIILSVESTKVFIIMSKFLTMTFTVTAAMLAVGYINKLIINYKVPWMQKRMILIALFPPFYSATSLYSEIMVKKWCTPQILEMLRALYESLLIFYFYQLVIGYVCFSDKVRFKMILWVGWIR